MGKVITVAMHKGGVGKTTLLSNIVGSIRKNKPEAKVLIIDTDGQGNALMSFGLSPADCDTGLHNVILDNEPLEECIYTIEDNLHIIPSTEAMDFIEVDVLLDDKLKDNAFGLLDKAIVELKENYDYIFIDTPPSISIVTGNALKVSDEVIIPFQPETYGVSGVEKIVATIDNLNESLGSKIHVLGIVGMMVDRRTDLHKILLQDAKAYSKSVGIPMFDTVIPKSIKFANATAYEGVPATLQKGRRHEIVEHYHTLTEELLEKLEARG
ncbi:MULTISPECIES: ParA family protein [unclassified Exiguobacterium]|uniref:ParA family protein n=1 Tax=unclassified Exiguobacterium TaxID=2644629 RepID=UPI001BE545DC|nr:MULTISPECIES: ParA family protein [unclassified Exiguobacterium]